jgi:hypothetical protein
VRMSTVGLLTAVCLLICAFLLLSIPFSFSS